jgi:hypothetical protein
MKQPHDWVIDHLTADLVRMTEARAEALEQRDRARALACRLEEELALIRRAGQSRRLG